MQILTTKNLLLSTSALFILAACETTTLIAEPEPEQETCVGEQVPDGALGCMDPLPEPIVVTTGTTDGDISSNGLRFADGDEINPGDLMGGEGPVTLTLRAAKMYTAGDDGGLTEASSELVDLEITTFVNEGGDLIATVDLGGETSLINLSDTGMYCDGGPTTSSTGTDWCYAAQWVSSNIVIIYGFGGDHEDYGNWQDSKFQAFAGLETDPDLLEFKGLATYHGDYSVFLASVAANESGWLEGGIEINADFGAGAIDGYIEGEYVHGEFEGEIAGNGWTAETTDLYVDVDGTVDGGAQFDGVFYGATGEETAGTIIVDIEVTTEVSEDVFVTTDIVGEGFFSAEENGEGMCFDC